MAQTGLTIRTKLNQRVFVAPPATSCVLTPVVTSTTGSYGGYDGNAVTYGTPETILAVPYGVMSDSKDYNSFGLDNDGVMKLAVKHTVSTTIGDFLNITSLSGTFQITEIEPYPYDGINLCTILTIRQTLRD